jgi:hypothetical protein
MISLVHLVLVFFFIFKVIQHIFSFFTSPVKVAMVIILGSTPKKGGERRKRPLHTVDTPDLRSPGVKNLVETVFSCLPLFEPIPASKIAIDHRVGQDVHWALISPVDAGNLLMPTADDYTSLLFHKSSNNDRVAGTLDTVDGPPAPVVMAAGRPARGRGGKGGRRHGSSASRGHIVSFVVSKPTVHPMLNVHPARDMMPNEVSILWISRSDLEALRSNAGPTTCSAAQQRPTKGMVPDHQMQTTAIVLWRSARMAGVPPHRAARSRADVEGWRWRYRTAHCKH